MALMALRVIENHNCHNDRFNLEKICATLKPAIVYFFSAGTYGLLFLFCKLIFSTQKRQMTELRLREILKERKISVSRLAEQSGISASNLSNYMNGKISPTLETLGKISETLNIEISELFRKSDDIALMVRVNGETYEINKDEIIEFIKHKRVKNEQSE